MPRHCRHKLHDQLRLFHELSLLQQPRQSSRSTSSPGTSVWIKLIYMQLLAALPLSAASICGACRKSTAVRRLPCWQRRRRRARAQRSLPFKAMQAMGCIWLRSVEGALGSSIRTATPQTPRPTPTRAPTPRVQSTRNCHPSYPTVCIPPPPPDLDCGDIPYRRFPVVGSDPHWFDGDGDGIGCEWG